MQVLGVDIGGTKIAAGVVDENARVGESIVVETKAADGYEVSIGQVWKAIDALIKPEHGAIGICSPGPLNPKTGVVINPPNLFGWHNVKLAEMAAARYGKPAFVENDANAAGLAEALFGAARGFPVVLYATWSTGIGTGLVIGGKIFHGKNGAAAEGGHVGIDYQSDAVCNCGVRGCIEALASGPAIVTLARKWLPNSSGTILKEPLTTVAIGEAFRAGDSLAVKVIDEICVRMSAWLGSLVSMLDPDIIVIGGGVTKIGEPLFERLRALTPGRTINQFAGELPIVPAALNEHVGVLGAAAVAYANS